MHGKLVLLWYPFGLCSVAALPDNLFVPLQLKCMLPSDAWYWYLKTRMLLKSILKCKTFLQIQFELLGWQTWWIVCEISNNSGHLQLYFWLRNTQSHSSRSAFWKSHSDTARAQLWQKFLCRKGSLLIWRSKTRNALVYMIGFKVNKMRNLCTFTFQCSC